MSTYFVDNVNGKAEASGFSEKEALKDYLSISPKAGDIILFKRGSVYRSALNAVSGSDAEPVIYGAYGEGEAPIFMGSVDLSCPDAWELDGDNVWRCTKDTNGDVGNLVFNDDECTATFRWTKEELVSQGDFYDGRGRREPSTDDDDNFYMYSEGNPAKYYKHIEAVPYGARAMCKIVSNITIEDICFMNCGVHGLAGAGKNVIIRRCKIKNIGGCAWSRELKIRFGNAIEFWVHAENVLIEDNEIVNVYDSCVTHQGPGAQTVPAKNFICRNNKFDTYGMAAFEYRDKMMINSSFVGNVCERAGCGFAMLGEELPRRSEIWPQPMGHHIFLWRINEPTDGGGLVISGNTFGQAPVGAAIYSIICKEAEDQMTIDNNLYTKNDTLLVHIGDKSYNSLSEYSSENCKDKNSKYVV